jgi:type III restriction enzyme
MTTPETHTSAFEVSEPILNSPFEEPKEYWYIREGQPAEKRPGRRRSLVFPPRTQTTEWDLSDGTLIKSEGYPGAYEMVLVNQIRQRVGAWRTGGYPGATRTTLELLAYWNRDGREKRLFFTQREAAETIIFLTEARLDFLQGICVPIDEASSSQQAQGIKSFIRHACKMATGSGKSTVMAMLAAWSILNKITDCSDARFSDVVLVVCPNVTIRSRLGELDPEDDEASLYRTRDLVPAALMPFLRQGRVLIMNWHNFELQESQTAGTSAKVVKTGVPYRTKEMVSIGAKTTTARGTRYISLNDLDQQISRGQIAIVKENRDRQGNLKTVEIEAIRYRESETAWVQRLFGKEIGGKQNILVLNDEAHHAYRIRSEDQTDSNQDADEDDDYEKKEATVWIEGLDRLHKHRGINLCVDLSATPYFLGAVGRDANRPFPWIVSDFSLIDAIESGLVKVPQLAVRDTTGAAIPGYFNIWDWILPQLTPAERGGKKGSPKPDAILKYAHTPIAMLGGLWEELRKEWRDREDARPPVFIIVCKNTKIAKVIYEWLADDVCPLGIPSANIEGFRNRGENRGEKLNTIRVDSKVIHETDTGESKSDEARWMRFTLDMVGKVRWPSDSQGNPIYPEEFMQLASKLNRPLDPPGKNIRCIVSVGMLTEGWDCNTVTHIIGLRPFMSQLLCEQVVGRGLRRASYELNAKNRFNEEVAKVFGVPFEVIPFKADSKGGTQAREKRYHVFAVPEKARYEIRFPRVEGYTRAIRNRVTVDWSSISTLELTPGRIPPTVDMKASLPNNQGRPSLSGPGALENVTLNPYRAGRRFQELVFQMATALTRSYRGQADCEAPAHVLFPQFVRIVRQYLQEYVKPLPPAEIIDVFLSPYYGWCIERLSEAIRPDHSQGEAPELPRVEKNREMGSTAEVDFWTSREPREVVQSHLNYIVPDTHKWEQSAAYYIDTHPATAAFVKNAGLGFSVPYLHNGEGHDYVPDFIVRLNTADQRHLILETKGYDPLVEVKRQAAERWVAAVNADGRYGVWSYEMVKRPEDVRDTLARKMVEAITLDCSLVSK